MAKALRTVGLVVLILGALGAGAATAVLRGWSSSSVTLDLQNKSGRSIEAFVVHHETCGTKGSLTGNRLSAGESRKITLSVCGEGGFRVDVMFSDGTRVSGSERYVEPGYVVTETVTSDAITSGVRTYGR